MARFDTRKTERLVSKFKAQYERDGASAASAVATARHWSDMQSRLDLERHYNRFYTFGIAVYVVFWVVLPFMLAITAFAYFTGVSDTGGALIFAFLTLLFFVVTYPVWKKRQNTVFSEIEQKYPYPEMP